jgi:hypothetical protein
MYSPSLKQHVQSLTETTCTVPHLSNMYSPSLKQHVQSLTKTTCTVHHWNNMYSPSLKQHVQSLTKTTCTVHKKTLTQTTMIYHHEFAPSSLCSDIVMVNAHRRSCKYKFHSIWHLALSSTTTTKSFITPNRTPESIIRRLNNNTNNGPQYTKQKTKYWATLKSRGKLSCPRRVSSSCSCSGTCRLTDVVCLYTYEFWLSLCKIVRKWVILLLPLFTLVTNPMESNECGRKHVIVTMMVIQPLHFILLQYGSIWMAFSLCINWKTGVAFNFYWLDYIYMCSNMDFNNHRKVLLLSLILLLQDLPWLPSRVGDKTWLDSRSWF